MTTLPPTHVTTLQTVESSISATTLITQALADGYQPGGQSGPDLRIAAIDAGMCAEAMCEECGHAGLEYHPYLRATPASYIIIAVCPACNAGIEL